jgi:hypothetical protein
MKKECFMDIETEQEIIRITKPTEIDLTEKQVDILIALSDNKGHSAMELAKSIESTEQYLSDLLGELSSYSFGGSYESFVIEYHHIKDPLALLHKLQDQRDSVSKYIFKNMHTLIKEKLASSDMERIIVCLSYGLGTFLTDENFYSQERFAKVKLSEDTKKLLNLKEKLKGINICVLNRSLMADAYPEEISKPKISIIYKKLMAISNKTTISYFINPDLRTFYFIMGNLEYRILLDRSRLAVMEVRLKKYMTRYCDIGGHTISRSELEKEIKDGRYDMTYFRNRYLKNINNLLTFLTSNYVAETMDKFDYRKKLTLTLPFPLEDPEHVEFEDTSIELSLEEINDLKQKFQEKF